MNTYPSIDLKATGNRIKQLRKERNLRVQDISDYMGFMEPQAVYKWQRGESLPSVDNLFALSRLFDTPMESILMEHEEAENASSFNLQKNYVFCSYNVSYVIMNPYNYIFERNIRKGKKKYGIYFRLLASL